MISTPDAVLQAMIKRSLQESGCPVHIGEVHNSNIFNENPKIVLPTISDGADGKCT